MQKDIRHYDMKEVKFEQDGTDRRFLTLEVSTYLTRRSLKKKVYFLSTLIV